MARLDEKHRCRIAGIHPVVMDRFLNYSWPGNVRELRNVLERAVILAGEGMILEKNLAMDAGDGDNGALKYSYRRWLEWDQPN